MKLKTLFIAAFAVASLHGQEKPADPYRGGNARPAAPREDISPNISICYETFSVPLAMAAKIQRTQLSDPELYKQLLAAVEKEDARQESFTVLRARSGEKASVESISEQIYATDLEPATKPDASQGQKPGSGVTRTPATPKAFETRNTGFNLEIAPVTDPDRTIIDIRLLAEHVTLVGHTTHGQGLSEIKMPVFEKQSVNNSATIRVNQPYLLGTPNRTPNSKVDPDSANRVWFAFITGTLAKP